MNKQKVVLDTNVLYGGFSRDFLLLLFTAGMYEAKRAEKITQKWVGHFLVNMEIFQYSKRQLLILLCIVASQLVCNPVFSQATANTSVDFPKTSSENEVLGKRAHLAGQYLVAAKYFVRAFELNASSPDGAYSAACAYALAGDKNAAFLWLEKVRQSNFVDFESAKNDKDLTSLHNDPRWSKFIGAVETAGKRQARLWDSEAWQTSSKEQLTEDQRIAGLSKFWSEVKYNFVYTDRLIDLDWDALYFRYLPKVRTAKSTFEYYQLLMEMCALLQDGHTNVYAPEEIYNKNLAPFPFKTKLIENRVIITAVGDPELVNKGLVRGVEIVTVNNREVKEFSKLSSPYIVASTPQDMDERLYHYQFLRGNIDEKLEFGLRNEDGKSFTLTIGRTTQANNDKTIGGDSMFFWRMLDGGIAHVILNTFETDEVLKLYIKNFPEISKAKAIILDVRRNGGGNGDIGFEILSTLTEKKFSIARSSTRNYKPAFRAWGRGSETHVFPQEEFLPNLQNQYKGEVVVLTSGMTFSAAEDFVVAFKNLKRGSLIGSATAGSTGQPLFFSLPGGGMARVCTKQDTFPDGTAFVGVGIKPDLEAHQTLADYRAKKDTALNFAVLQLKKKLNE